MVTGGAHRQRNSCYVLSGLRRDTTGALVLSVTLLLLLGGMLLFWRPWRKKGGIWSPCTGEVFITSYGGGRISFRGRAGEYFEGWYNRDAAWALGDRGTLMRCAGRECRDDRGCPYEIVFSAAEVDDLLRNGSSRIRRQLGVN